MIRRFFCALTALCMLCGCAFARDYTAGLVRLHVIAEDDSPAAQAFKLEMRDACLECARTCISGAEDADAAYMRLNAHLDDFVAACRDRARALGYDGNITAETGVFEFPDRLYGDVLVPAGEYRALRITIGEGEGRNWWCVIYPGLCSLDASTLDDPGSLLSWLRKKFGGV